MEAAGQRMLSSLPLQVALFFNQWFLILYFVLTLVGFLYKGEQQCALVRSNVAARLTARRLSLRAPCALCLRGSV